MKNKANKITLGFDENNRPQITLTVADKSTAVKQQVARLKQSLEKGKLLAFEVKEHKETRSKDANAYFHVLVDKIAKALNRSTDGVKADLVLQYGAMDKTAHNETVGVKVPKGTQITNYYPYARWFKTTFENGREFDCYIFYKRTHTMDTGEMAKLIDGTVQEAKELGIETKTPEQIAEMLSLMEGKK